MEDDPNKINDFERQIEARILKTGEEYAASNKRQKAENKARADNRSKIKEMGISTHAYQIAVKVVKDLTEGERADWIRDFQMVVKVLGARQADLFPDEKLKAEARAQRAAEKKAKEGRTQAEMDADSDKNPRSDPNAGGAQIDLEEAIRNQAAEQAEGEAVLQGRTDAWREGYIAHGAGAARSDSPHVEGSAETRDWLGGYEAASQRQFEAAAPEPVMEDGEVYNDGAGKDEPPAPPVEPAPEPKAKKSQSAKASEKKAKAGIP